MVWNDISHYSPVPAYIAALSYQSISTPSRLLFKTNVAKLFAVAIGSFPAEVGNSVAPNADTKSLIPLEL